MRYLALATDYDNTLATDNRLTGETRRALERLRASGRRIIVVTGRRLDDLLSVCDCIGLFDYVVAENGAVVYDPRSRHRTLLASPPPSQFVANLRKRGVDPVEVGDVIVATYTPHETQVMGAIRELGLELQVFFNRQAVMVLPPSINKASGLKVALRNLGMSPHEVVAVGDAENDHSFLLLAECAVAVANAVESIKEIVTFVTEGEAGAGVVELIDQLLANDLCHVEQKLSRHHIAIGTRTDGTMVWLPPFGRNVLVAGTSGCGKSTLATGLIERFARQMYQMCVVDPEGDYVNLQTLVTIGNQDHAPGIAEVLAVLRDPYVHANVCLLGLPLADRPAYFSQLVSNLHAVRMRTGRPHWLVVDEAHHLLPDHWGHKLPWLSEAIFITVDPRHLSPKILESIDVVIAMGRAPEETLGRFARTTHQPLPRLADCPAETGDAVCWFPKSGEAPFRLRAIPGQMERIRHHRKYAEGDVRQHSFYFRGPAGRHNLKAQNLGVFCQIAAGISEETWLYHLHRHDYSRWMRNVIKNPDLASEVEMIEKRHDLAADQTRVLIIAAVEARYTLPA